MNRNLDPILFPVKRDGRLKNICFTDLTPDEREKVLEDKSEDFVRNLCFVLADVLKQIGDQFDLTGKYPVT